MDIYKKIYSKQKRQPKEFGNTKTLDEDDEVNQLYKKYILNKKIKSDVKQGNQTKQEKHGKNDKTSRFISEDKQFKLKQNSKSNQLNFQKLLQKKRRNDIEEEQVDEENDDEDDEDEENEENEENEDNEDNENNEEIEDQVDDQDDNPEFDDDFDMNDFEEFNKALEKEDNPDDSSYEEESEAEDQTHLPESDIKYSDMYNSKSFKSKSKQNQEQENMEDDIFNIQNSSNQNLELNHHTEHFANSNLINQIQDLENRMVNKKDWQLRGEITSNSRPVGSLLQEHLDFKVTSRPKPLPSAEINTKIEKMIKTRVASDLFDDPKRVVVNVDKKSKIGEEIDFQKSKKGLAELYEEEMIDNTETINNLTPEKVEVLELFDELFSMFNGLTNNNFISEGLNKEMNVLRGVKAIKIEDVSKHVDSKKALSKTKDNNYNPSKAELVSHEELDSKELKKRHRQMKRKVHKKIYERELRKKKVALSKDYDSKYEVNLALKKSKDKDAKKNISSGDLKSKKFFADLNLKEEKGKELATKKKAYQKEVLGYDGIEKDKVKKYKL